MNGLTALVSPGLSLASPWSAMSRTWIQRALLEQALHALLSAEVGLALVNSPDTSSVDEILRQVRTQMDESTFISIAERVAREPSEPAYGLTQTAWAAAILRSSIPA